MSKQEPQSRVKRYDFNGSQKQPNQDPKNFKVWPWILGLVIVIGMLVVGIKFLTANDNNQAGQSSSSMVSASSTSASSSSKNSASSSSKTTHSNSTNKSSNKGTNANNHPANDRKSQNNPAPQNNGGFSAPRQFSSVSDATNWAKATQSSWIQAGYNNYTITSDGQGYYVLNFTK